MHLRIAEREREIEKRERERERDREREREKRERERGTAREKSVTNGRVKQQQSPRPESRPIRDGAGRAVNVEGGKYEGGWGWGGSVGRLGGRTRMGGLG